MFEHLFARQRRSTLIDAAFRDISEMLRRSQEMLDLALAALLDNRSLEVDLDAMDDAVDEGERMVRRSVLEHLAVNPQQDLVASLVLGQHGAGRRTRRRLRPRHRRAGAAGPGDRAADLSPTDCGATPSGCGRCSRSPRRPSPPTSRPRRGR